MDAGQSGVRARLLIDHHQVNEIERPGVLTDRPVLPQLARVARDANPVPGTVLAVGSSGVGDDVTAEQLLVEVRPLGITRVLLAHDSITSYLGALGDQPGAVVASGTGVVTLALGKDNMARVDGWGHLIGDAGSGFWIGRAGLDAVLREYDGRGQKTALTPVILADFPDLSIAYLQLQADPLRVSRIASYARIIADLAQTDQVCAQICRQAADELANSVISGLTRVGQGDRDDPMVSTLGKVFNGSVLAAEFTRLLGERFPGIRLLPPAGTSLDGAALLAELGEGSPLRQRVRVAS